MVLWEQANEHLHIQVFEDASAVIREKNGRTWRMGPVALQEMEEIDRDHVWTRHERSVCEEYAGRFKGEALGEKIRFKVRDESGQEKGAFICSFRLDGPWWEVRVEEIDEALPNLTFPGPLEAEGLVLPQGVGRWIRRPLDKRYFFHFVIHLMMRWYGGTRGNGGWLAVFDEGHADAGVLAAELAVMPVWLKSLGRWTGTRTVRYRFLDGGYVELAKAFRSWAQEKGLFKTLDEKIAEIPAVASLIGGRSLSLMQAIPFRRERFENLLRPVPRIFSGKDEGAVAFITHAQAARIMQDAKELGMKKGFFQLRGWLKGGYDETHPDIWPPEPALGTLEEFIRICGEKDPYLTCLQDNYQDIYVQSESFPRGVCRTRDGSLMRGGIWYGGQAYILNSRYSLEYAHRNWEQLKILGNRAIYVDTVATERLKQSWEDGDTQTRGEDEYRKKELLAFFRGKGLVIGSEVGADFAIPYMDWSPVGVHRRVPGESVPLWPLVYHDCVVGFRGPWDEESLGPERLRRTCLENMLWGYALTFGGFTADNWDLWRKPFAETFYVDDWMDRIGRDEMVRHQFAAEDSQVELAEYRSGAAIAVNFSAEEREYQGIRISAGGYKILK
ncbi:MAG: DUF5696 domain-containing protein [Bacillota bacterium]